MIVSYSVPSTIVWITRLFGAMDIVAQIIYIVYLNIGIFAVIIACLELSGKRQDLLGFAIFLLSLRCSLRSLDLEDSLGNGHLKVYFLLDVFLNMFTTNMIHTLLLVCFENRLFHFSLSFIG